MRFPLDLLRRCRFLTGPTASGKSDVGLILAERWNAEIVLLDSMTLYRGMDVGTAKPTAEEQTRVPHHLVDILDPQEEFSVAEYLAAAETACRAILDRGRTPLFVGGTALYLRSLLRGVFEGPPADWGLRQTFEQDAREQGAEALHRRLRAVDPPTADRLPAADVRRVIRALEVFELTGTPLSQHHREEPLPVELRPPVYWLSPPRPWLHERIDRRVELMFARGLLEEVGRLLDEPGGLGRTARQGLGYKEVIEFFESGSTDVAALMATIQTRTRQFAKRQLTWYRNLPECRPLEMTGEESPQRLAALIVDSGL